MSILILGATSIAACLLASCDSPAPATPAGTGSNDTAAGTIGDTAASPDAAADAPTAKDATALNDASATPDTPAPQDATPPKDTPAPLADASPADTTPSPDTALPPDAAPAPDTGPALDTPPAADAAPAGCKPGEFKPLQSDTCQSATCPNLKQSAHSLVQDAAKQFAEVPPCKADAECVPVSQDTACSGECPAIVNAASKGEFAKAVKQADAFCKLHGVAAKCGFPIPSCIAPTPACVAGKCVYTKPPTSKCGDVQPANTVCEGTVWACKPGHFKGYGGGECHEATCENLAKANNEAIGAAIAKAQVCKVGADDECIHIATATACQGTCGAAVNAGMQNDVLKVVGWVDDNLCKAFGYAAKCGYSGPKCTAPKPGCAAGKCEYSGVAP
ncbi:MAG: hypothetical protein EXR79_10480 [Myxococcales bacterium]|nr:hypothetical protein [Myxococcales bacterium]